MPATGSPPQPLTTLSGRAAGLLFPFLLRSYSKVSFVPAPAGLNRSPAAGAWGGGPSPQREYWFAIYVLDFQLGCVESLLGTLTVSTRALHWSCFVSVRSRRVPSSLPSAPFLPVPADAPSGIRSPSSRWVVFFFSLCTLLPTIPPPPHPITFFHRQNVLINLLLLFPDLTWWPTQSTTLTKRSLRDKTRLTSEEQGKCFRGRVQFLTWTPTRTGADPGRVGREEGLSLSHV